MNKILLKKMLIVLFVIFASNVYSQNGWFSQSSGTSVVLWGISFINNSTGYVTGSNTFIKTTNGGSNWISIPTGISFSGYNIKFVNEFTGYISCDAGKVLKTTNGGLNWNLLQIATSSDLWGIFFVNENTGFVSGSPPGLFKTTNGGQSWMNQTPATPYAILSLDFFNENTGYATGHSGQFFVTSNSGTNWISKNTGTTSDLYSVKFFNANTGFLGGASGLFFKTTNFGNNWSTVNIGVSSDITGIAFTLNNIGYIVGTNGSILKSTNEGSNWSSQQSGTTNTLNKVIFLDDFIGFATGFGGVILKTTTGGEIPAIPIFSNFSPKYGTPGNSLNIYGFNFNSTPLNNIVYFGSTKATVNSGNSSQLNVTIPQGATYSPITVLTNNLICLSNPSFVPTFNGAGGITTNSLSNRQDLTTGNGVQNCAYADLDGDGKSDLITANYGAGNITMFRNISSGGTISFASGITIATGNAPRYVAVADLDNDGKLDILVTNESSNTISLIRNVSIPGSISMAAKVDLTTPTMPGLIISRDFDGDGKMDIALSTWNSGKLSIFRNLSTVGNFNFGTRTDLTAGSISYGLVSQDFDSDGKPDICIANPGNANFSIFRNTSTQGSITFAAKVDIASLNSREIFSGDIDGDDKADLVFTNVISNTVSVYRNISTTGNISFATAQNFTVGDGNFGISLGDIDGDTKVDVIASNSNSTNFSVLRNTSTSGNISFASKVDFACGSEPRSVAICDLDNDNKSDVVISNFGSGTITIYKNNSLISNITKLENNIPNNYFLSQNYPNPFNPSTNIRFQIKESRFTTLKIYNILGKEIETLVNEKLSPGSYSVDWNASQYPSGVYFYRLQSGDFVETKRMMFLK